MRLFFKVSTYGLCVQYGSCEQVFTVYWSYYFALYALSSVKAGKHIGTRKCVRPFVCPFRSCYGIGCLCVISLFKMTDRIYRIITNSGITSP